MYSMPTSSAAARVVRQWDVSQVSATTLPDQMSVQCAGSSVKNDCRQLQGTYLRNGENRRKQATFDSNWTVEDSGDTFESHKHTLDCAPSLSPSHCLSSYH